eukprot:gene14383-17010_t
MALGGCIYHTMAAALAPGSSPAQLIVLGKVGVEPMFRAMMYGLLPPGGAGGAESSSLLENARASRLSGKEVRGDALVANVYLSAEKDVMKYSDQLKALTNLEVLRARFDVPDAVTVQMTQMTPAGGDGAARPFAEACLQVAPGDAQGELAGALKAAKLEDSASWEEICARKNVVEEHLQDARTKQGEALDMHGGGV